MKRFWKQATASQSPGGWAILLDGRPVTQPIPGVVPPDELSTLRDRAAMIAIGGAGEGHPGRDRTNLG